MTKDFATFSAQGISAQMGADELRAAIEEQGLAGKLVVSQDGATWGRVKNTYTDAFGNERANLSFWLDRPNFQTVALTRDLAEVAEGSYEHRLMGLAGQLVLVAGYHGGLARLREIVASVPSAPRKADYVAVARVIKKEMMGTMRSLPKLGEVAAFLKAFVEAERA